MVLDIAQSTVNLLTFLLPGFLAAWVYYGLTSHPKPGQFERIVQALVFTFVVQALVDPLRWVLEIVGAHFAVRSWDVAAETLSQLFLGLLFGVVLAYLTNKDTVHKSLRKIGFTSRTSHPSEWYSVFSEKIMFVILHLQDGRRLYGWPKEWPVERDKGQFYIMVPSWILESGEMLHLPQLDGVLVCVEDVRWVEFVQPEELKND